MIISTMTIMELSIAVGGILGALAGLVRASSCQKVKCLWGGLECDKTVIPPVVEPDVIDDIELVPLPHSRSGADPRPTGNST